jgi:hypothetical protein
MQRRVVGASANPWISGTHPHLHPPHSTLAYLFSATLTKSNGSTALHVIALAPTIATPKANTPGIPPQSHLHTRTQLGVLALLDHGTPQPR